jgi:DNA modification methylase
MITDINQLPADSESAFVCADCMDVMRRFPDGYFDLSIVDPPYGINMGHTCGIGRGGTTDHSVGNPQISVYGANTKALAKANFTTRSTIPQRRTGNISRNWRECQKHKSSGAGISSWII